MTNENICYDVTCRTKFTQKWHTKVNKQVSATVPIPNTEYNGLMVEFSDTVKHNGGRYIFVEEGKGYGIRYDPKQSEKLETVKTSIYHRIIKLNRN